MKREQLDQWLENYRDLFAQAKALLPKFSIKNIPAANMELARLHTEKGNLQDALLRYRIVLKLQPNNAEAWAGLGSVRAMAGDKPGAEQALSHALALKPGHPAALSALEELRRKA